ncbi:MAG: hypothetical protein Q4D34_05950 [Eggerthellaceae bacterium]|nr:hypothetical protein [Eggerthellaceae bacterium]
MASLKNISCSRLGALLASVALALCLFTPATAEARFNDLSAADPFGSAASRSQDSWNSLMATMGEVILPGEVPDGTYNIDAITSSTMCWLYPTASECSGRIQDPPWCHCTLTVSGGTMTVHFYLSQAYTHMRWGTSYEAAAAANEDGSDGDGYIYGSPSTGYVPHYFALEIPALNWAMDISTYGGNNADFESGKWWWRLIAFKATDEVYAAMGGSDYVPDDPADSGSSSGSGTNYDGVIDDINSRIADSQVAPSASESSVAESVSAATGRGVVIHGVTFDSQAGAASSADAPQISTESEKGFSLSVPQIIMLIGLGAVIVGIVLRSVSFAAGKKR